MKVHIQHESERGCGFRSLGADGVGLYLMGPGQFEGCERLPFPLTVCPCCGAGIKFSRGFTWIDPMRLFDPAIEPRCDNASSLEVVKLLKDDRHSHNHCGLCSPWLVGDRAGLMWVGERHYPTPHHFAREARERGVSKKISALPNNFKLGEHIIYLAHRKAYTDWDNASHPVSAGVFMAFTPRRLDLVIEDETDIPPKAEAIKTALGEKARLVKVVREEQQSFI